MRCLSCSSPRSQSVGRGRSFAAWTARFREIRATTTASCGICGGCGTCSRRRGSRTSTRRICSTRSARRSSITPTRRCRRWSPRRCFAVFRSRRRRTSSCSRTSSRTWRACTRSPGACSYRDRLMRAARGARRSLRRSSLGCRRTSPSTSSDTSISSPPGRSRSTRWRFAAPSPVVPALRRSRRASFSLRPPTPRTTMSSTCVS